MRTGRPERLASSHAMGVSMAEPFPPKSPPMVTGWKSTSSTSTPTAAASIFLPGCGDLFGAQTHRLFRIEHGRQLLVLDLDELDGPLRNLLVVRGDGRDLLSGEEDLALGEHRHVDDGTAVARARRQVGARDHGVHAPQRRRLRGIDAHDLGAREGAAQRPAGEDAGDLDVGRVLGCAGRLGDAVDAGRRRTDGGGSGIAAGHGRLLLPKAREGKQ